MSSCNYINHSDYDILSSISSNSSSERDEIKRVFNEALNFARKKHAGQYRDCWEKYINHLKRTLFNCFNELDSDIPNEYTCDLITSALLHDTIEDTDTSSQELLEKFWLNSSLIVSKISKKPLIQFGWNKQLRNQEYYSWLKKIALVNWDVLNKIALLIKAGDRLDNLSTMCSWNIENRRKKIEETSDYLMPVFYAHWNTKLTKALLKSIKLANNRIDEILET